MKPQNWIRGLIAKDFDAKMGDFQTILHNTKSVYKIQNLHLDRKGCFGLSSSYFLKSWVYHYANVYVRRLGRIPWSGRRFTDETKHLCRRCFTASCVCTSPTEIPPSEGIMLCLTVPSWGMNLYWFTCHSPQGLWTAPSDSPIGRCLQSFALDLVFCSSVCLCSAIAKVWFCWRIYYFLGICVLVFLISYLKMYLGLVLIWNNEASCSFMEKLTHSSASYEPLLFCFSVSIWKRS